MRTEAQKRADRKYYLENKERKQKQSEKASTRRYINKCDINELKEVQQLIENRMVELKDWLRLDQSFLFEKIRMEKRVTGDVWNDYKIRVSSCFRVE